MNLQKELNLNKHPGDCVPYSLIAAKNIKLSNDGHLIVNEEGLEDCVEIANAIHNNGIDYFKIVGAIPTSTELVLFVLNTDTRAASIYRYKDNGDCIRVNTNWKYNGGKIKGTYTYNVKNHLIISIAEYDANIDVPLKTINLDLDNDRPDSEMSIIPEVTLPRVTNLKYVSGSAYKGYYFMFIRYKIDKINYTKWYSIGFPIYNDTIMPQVINKVCLRREYVVDPKDVATGYCFGNTDSFSDTKDICNQTFEVSVNGGRNSLFQIGFIVCKKDSTKAFRTDDLNNNVIRFNRDILVEYNINDLTTDYYNYYNVGNIINYKNRVYISNYNEKTNNDNRILSTGETLEDIAKQVNVQLRNKYVDSYYNSYTTLNGISEKGPYTKIAIIEFVSSIYANWSYSTSNQYPFRTFNASLYGIVIQGIALNEYLNVAFNKKIKVYSIGNSSEKEYYAAHCFIVPETFRYENNEASYSLPSKVKVICLTNENGLLTKDVEITSGIVIIDDARLNIDECQIRIAHNIIDPRYDFEERKKNDTLIPGEVYNFFIHFVDKYGDASNGYKLYNKDKYINNVINDGSACSVFTIDWNNNNQNFVTYYVVVSGLVSLYDISNNIRSLIANNKIVVYTANPITNPNTNIIVDSSGNLSSTNREDLYKLIEDQFIEYDDIKYNNMYAYQIINTGSYNPVENNIIYGSYDREAKFGYYENINGDELFRIPDLKLDAKPIGNDAHISGWNYNMNNTFNKFYVSVNINNNIWSKVRELGYVGWFISYEKVEPITRYTGLLTRADYANFKRDDKYQHSNYTRYIGSVQNNKDGDKCYLYSSRFDIDDSIKYDFNTIRIDSTCEFDPYIKKNDVIDLVATTKYPYSYNMPIIGGISRNKYMPINNYNIVVADSVVNSRAGLGTALEMDDYKNLLIDGDNMYIATVLNLTRNIYINKEKELIRLNDVIYNSGNYSIEHGYNGRMTYDGVLIYNATRVIFNQGDNIIYQPDGRKYYNNANDSPVWFDCTPFIEYIQFPLYSDKFFESKYYNNPPTNIVFSIKEETERKSIAFGTFVEPKNSVDLFKDPIGNVDQYVPKLLTQYRNDIINVTRYDKTIRRSNVIQDESEINAWRVFPIEGYKNITENKGIVTNLIGIGYYLLVHTEHSMFMFDISASLKTRDQDVQLYQPDAFEVDYKEVFTSDKGYGGLQDDLAYIVGEFGYIFYNDDFHKIYQFDDGQLKLMYNDIQLWLDKYRPVNARFAHDKFNNRILIKFDYYNDNINPNGRSIVTNHNEVISYNYNIGKFISLHDYYFSRAWSTKTKCYFITEHNNDSINCPLHRFTNEHNFGRFNTDMGDDSRSLYLVSKQVDSENVMVNNSYIDIIINESYDMIKFLEFIKYKVRKIHIPIYSDNINNPVDLRVHPYSGDILRIFNEDNDTEDIDININTINQFNRYKKPWYELTQWNFNYFRNKINDHSAPKNIPSDKLRRLYGNYFVIRFIFNNVDNKRIEFESLECAQTKFRKL